MDDIRLLDHFTEDQLISILKKCMEDGPNFDLDKAYNIKTIKINNYTLLVNYYPEIKNKSAIYLDIAQIMGFIHGFLGTDLENKKIINIGVQALVDHKPYIYIISSLKVAKAIAQGDAIYWLKNSIVNEPIIENQEALLEDQETLLLVEGESELIAYPILFECMGYMIDIFKISIYPFSKSNLRTILQLLTFKDDKFYLTCDNDKEKEIIDLKREGLLNSNFHVLQKGEFEDYIQSDNLINILKSFTPKLLISREYIDNNRKNGLTTSKIISKYYHTNAVEFPVPKKPEIAKKIALHWAETIIPSEFEIIIKNVLTMSKN